MSRSPSRDRSQSRAGRTLAASGGGGGAAFDPASLSGKLLWLRAKDLTLDASPTTWADQSGLGHDATLTGATVGLLSGAPATATASSNYTSEPPSFAFDGLLTTFWDTNGTATGWLKGDWTTAFVAKKYRITRREGFATRMPTAWTLQGSNDDSSWTTLDTQTGITWPTAGTQTFTFTNTTAYRYYKLDVTANGGDTYLSVGDFHISPGGNALSLIGGSVSVPSDGGSGTSREVWLVQRVYNGNESIRTQSNLGTSGLQTNFPYSDGVVYEGAYATTRTTFTPTMSVYVPRIYRVSIAAGAWKAELDNVQQVAGTKTLGIQTAAPKLATLWDGQFAEVFIRSQVSTTQEVTDLIAYFNTEHGLTVT